MSLKKSHVNWHEAASCALQIELRDYSDLLEYIEEYVLGKNHYRIDLLIIKKLAEQTIPKNIAFIFKTFNLFEIKGVGSTLGIDSYYKTIGYAGLLINQSGEKDQYSCLDVSLSFLSCYYPRKLMKHLRDERKLSIEKISPGVYYINKETFNAQIIVTKELPPEDNLYLHQITNADRKSKGETSMYICEGLLNLCGTSSEEIIERTKKEDAEYYLPKIDQLSAQNDNLSSQIDYLRSLLKQHNIPFQLEAETNDC